jgi:hypothetical protein
VPGERADVLVVAAGGETLEWQTLRYDRGHGTGVLPDADVFQLRPDRRGAGHDAGGADDPG